MNEDPSAAQRPPVVARFKVRRGFRFALAGLICGFLGLAIAAYRLSVEADPPDAPKARPISEVLAKTIRRAGEKLRRTTDAAPAPTPAPPATVAWPSSRQLGLAASICGFLAVVFGCISWLVGEHRRWTWAALGVGVAALAWTHVIVAAAMAVGIALFILVLFYLG